MNKKLSAEYRSQQFNADVVYGGTPLDFEMYINNKYLQPYKSKNSSKISKDLKEENNYYTGASIITLGFGNNKSLFNEEEKTPESWNDLLKGEFTDLVVCTEHSNASIIKYFIACMMQNESYGEEYFKKLKDNGIKFVKGANATVEDIIDGKYKTGICIDYVAFSNVDEENNFSFNYPSKDNVILPTPIGLLNNCDNPENGKYLIDFILSKKGQEILAETGLSPARKDIKIKDTKNIINNCMKVDAKNLLANYDKYLEEFDFIFK